MLKLKSPIQLHLGALSAAQTEGFSKRICANYSLLNARWGAKDLLFLLACDQAPEPVPSGMTTLVQQTTHYDAHSVTVEVMNQVINRLLLDVTPRFTYQDQVYITSVLNRLGVTDVRQFVRQVRQLRIENESTLSMLKLYQNAHRRFVSQNGTDAPVRAPEQAQAQPVQNVEQVKAQMSMQVFQRLHTAQLSQTIQSFQKSALTVQNEFARFELRLSEYERMSSALTLAQLKQEVHQTSAVHLTHHLNQFEAGLLLPAPQSEDEVLSQAAVSVLVSAVDAALFQVLSRPALERELWFHTERAIQKSAESALQRFERYHTQSFLLEQTPPPSSEQALAQYVRELAQYQTWERQTLVQIEETMPPLSRQTAPDTAVMLHPAVPEPGEEDADTLSAPADSSRETAPPAKSPQPEEKNFAPFLRHLPPQTVRQMEQHLLREVERTERVHILPGQADEQEAPPASESGEKTAALHEQAKRLLSQMNEVTNETHFHLTQESALPPAQKDGRDAPPMVHVPQSQADYAPEAAQPRTQEQEDFSAPVQASSAPGQTALVSERLERFYQETAPAQERRAAQTEPVRMEPARSASTEKQPELTQENPPRAQTPVQTLQEPSEKESVLVTRQLERFEKETVQAQPVPSQAQGQPEREPVTQTLLSPEQAEREAPEHLKEQLRQIDRRNREMRELIERTAVPRTAASVSPDRARTLSQSLRALQAPETVLREIAAQEQARQSNAPAFTPQELRLLEVSDPQTKALYERILAYQNNPQAALEEGLLRPAAPGALQMELHQVSAPPSSEAPGALLRTAPENAEVYGETLRPVHAAAVPHPSVQYESSAAVNRIRLVHRRQEEEERQELLRSMGEQRISERMTTQEERRTVHTRKESTAFEQTREQTVQHVTKDVTELVNQTLQRQMRTISDQVYRQIEKRLQMERSRRGRF